MVFFQQERTAILSVHPMFLGPNLREHVRMQLAAQVEGTVRRPPRALARTRGLPAAPLRRTPAHRMARAALPARAAARGRRGFYCHGAPAGRPRAGH